MDVVFIMGATAGFFIGIGFSIYITNIVTNRVVKILTKSIDTSKKPSNKDRESADWWKDDDYDPRG